MDGVRHGGAAVRPGPDEDARPVASGIGDPVLELQGVVKTFRHVEALRGADFDVRAGEIVGLVGDNGAGKSTLVKVMAGVHQPDAGEIRIHGEPVSLDSPVTARDLGIHVVYQDLGLAPDLNAVENLYLGREMTTGGWLGRKLGVLDRRTMLQETQASLGRYKLDVPHPTQVVNTLSGGQRQRVAIVSAVLAQGSVILMDEPTAALGVEARRRVLDLIKHVRDQGTAVVVISHDLPDLMEIVDRFHIMRLGQRVAALRREEASLEKLVDIMAGVTSR